MSDTVILALIAGFPGIVAAIVSAFAAWTSWRDARKTTEVKDKVDVVHEIVNGQKEEMLNEIKDLKAQLKKATETPEKKG